MTRKQLLMHLLHLYKGRCSEKCWFWSFIKWNSLFINVSKKYDFDNLSQADNEDKYRKTC
jgi:hypothetical protein